jgi:hypothetical protein
MVQRTEFDTLKSLNISDTLLMATYLITPWSRVILEKLTGFIQDNNSPNFIESEGSLPQSQMPATCTYT